MNLIESIVRKTIHQYINENKKDESLLQQEANDMLEEIRRFLKKSKTGITVYDNPFDGQKRNNHAILGRYLHRNFVIYDFFDSSWADSNPVAVCILTHDAKYRTDSFDTSIPSIYDKGKVNPDFRVLPFDTIIKKLFEGLGIKYSKDENFNSNPDNFRKKIYLDIFKEFQANPKLCYKTFGKAKAISDGTGKDFKQIFNLICQTMFGTKEFINPYILRDLINYDGSSALKTNLWASQKYKDKDPFENI